MQSTGQYDEQIFKAFDYIFDVARRYNIRLNLAMTSNWQLNDGPSAVCMVMWIPVFVVGCECAVPLCCPPLVILLDIGHRVILTPV